MISAAEKRRIRRILISAVPQQYRTFFVFFSVEKPKRRIASYLTRDRVILIYIPHFDNQMDMIGAGLHEAAHHICWENHRRIAAPGNPPRHGSEFRRSLRGLVDDFNSTLGGEGRLIFNAKKPRIAPTFVPF